MTEADDEISTRDCFLGLFIKHQHSILTFIMTFVPNTADADDILQDTATIMWHKFSTFEPDSNFVKWGVTIARYRIMKFYEQRRSSWLKFDSDLTEKLLPHADEVIGMVDSRMDALKHCIGKLKQKDHELLIQRYEQKISIRTLAEKFDRSAEGLYKSFARIHRLLHECVNATLAAWKIP